MVSRDRLCLVALALFATAVLGGCGAKGDIRGGLLLQGFDTLAYPGQEITLTARLQGGDYLKGLEGYLVGFYQLHRKLGQARTDDEGLSEITFKPETSGNHVILARLEDPDVRKYAVPAVEIIVAAHDKFTPMVIVDLDRTIVKSGFTEVLADRAEPMAHSETVLSRVAKDRVIVYLTHRPDIFTEQSKRWLRKYNYPTGPLLVSTLSEFVSGSRKFKSARISKLKESFPAVAIGIGDKAGDAEAYLANDMRAILIIHPDNMPTAESVRLWIRRLRPLPEKVEVVESWPQVEELLFEGKRHPVSKALERLAELAERRSQETLGNSPKTPDKSRAARDTHAEGAGR
ncbi:MAG: hypothetical protein GWP05_04970 [Anaerolineaceae bacterium]|nr:hypothetical protein [Anaerolineaceae bacterium]